VTSGKAPVGSCRPWLTTTSATNCLAAASRQPAKSKVTMGDGLYSWLPMMADRLVGDDRHVVAGSDAAVEDADLIAGREEGGRLQRGLVAHPVGVA
jgi:hypothetical protein